MGSHYTLTGLVVVYITLITVTVRVSIPLHNYRIGSSIYYAYYCYSNCMGSHYTITGLVVVYITLITVTVIVWDPITQLK